MAKKTGNRGESEPVEDMDRINQLYDDIVAVLFQIKDIPTLNRIFHMISKELLEVKDKN